MLGGVSPHPPIVIPEIGEKNLSRVQKTRDGLQQLAGLIRSANPDTVVIIAPHGPAVQGAVTLLASPILEGNFREFGISGMSLRYGNDTRLVSRIAEEAAESDVAVVQADPARIASLRLSDTLHYSILVPLYYLRQAGVESRLVAGAVGLLPADKLYRFGQAVHAASVELGVRVVYLASGDLSHRLTEGAPAGYDPAGKVFDRKVVEALGKADIQALLNLEPGLVERAGECGLGPIISLFGALDGTEVVPEVISYEGPFGVGYCIAVFSPKAGRARDDAAGRPDSDDARPPAQEPKASRPAADPPPAPQAPHPFVRLARLALETYVREGRTISPPPTSPGLDRRAGAFVSLKKDGELRGCIGTLEPTAPSLAEEVIRNAIQSGTADPRFGPVKASELGGLVYSVDVLGPAEPVDGLDHLDPKLYGVIVVKDRRTGVLLPDLEGIDTAEEQVAIARQKAGIRPHEEGVRLFRFKVTRYR